MIVKFLQWNIWFPEKVERIAAFLKEVSPDIFCLQELTTNCDANPGISTGPYIAERLGVNSYIEIAQRSLGRERDSIENGIFSRFPIVERKSSYLIPPGPLETKDYSKEGRVYLEAQIDVLGTPISVATAHLSYTHRFEGSELKAKEISNLLTCTEAKRRFIFSGDLNATPDNPLIQELSQRFTHCGPPLHEKTWTTKDFNFGGFNETKLNWRLDYVFCSKDISCNSAKILSTDVSDHLPILVEFEIE